MIIFSQQPTEHSRLANSLVWMSKVQGFLDFSGQTCCFPWAIEKFGNYLDEKSFWMMQNDADKLYLARTKQELSAINISSLSRTVEHNYEIKNGLRPFAWEKLITYSDEFSCLYLSGNIDITEDNNMKLINDNELVIINEPFKLEFKNAKFSSSDYRKIIPKLGLLEKQIEFVNLHSLGKRKIGLHIRRGDYNNWADGKYFFDDDFWLAKVKQLTDNDCAVYVFTNEAMTDFHNKLKKLGAYVSVESFEVDFVRLMLMNEIYGPPSTFSFMASEIAKSCFGFNPLLTNFSPKS